MDDPKCNTNLNHSYTLAEYQQSGYISIQSKSGKHNLLLQLWIIVVDLISNRFSNQT